MCDLAAAIPLPITAVVGSLIRYDFLFAAVLIPANLNAKTRALLKSIDQASGLILLYYFDQRFSTTNTKTTELYRQQAELGAVRNFDFFRSLSGRKTGR